MSTEKGDLSAEIHELLRAIAAETEAGSDQMRQWRDQARQLISRLQDLPPYPQARKRDLQLNLIKRLGQQDIWQRSLEDFLGMAVVSIRESLNYYNVSCFMLDSTGRHLVLTAHAGAYRGRVSKGDHQEVEQGLMGWVVRHRRMLLANDVSREPHYLAIPGLATRSEICLPLFMGEKIEGVLNVESDEVDAFDQGDVVALEALAQQIAEITQMHRQTQAFERLRTELEGYRASDQFLGRSPAMCQVFNLINSVADSDISVLLWGETGTGKELAAQRIHQQSARRGKPFVAVNCAAIPEQLFESELFGHERSAFTGADRRRIGKLELAQGGTLFLDEVAEIPYTLQAKLLRAVESRRFTRVGGEKEIKVDVRILSATNQSLEELERQGRFRRDLYFRLNAVQVHLPPLRERQEDIPLLAAHFLRHACAKSGKQISSIAPPVLSALMAHTWPGNVRELENTIARAVLLEQTQCLAQVHLPIVGQGRAAAGGSLSDAAEEMALKEVCRIALEQAEREYLRRLLTRVRGNISQAARLAGINRRTLYNKLERYQIQRGDFLPSS